MSVAPLQRNADYNVGHAASLPVSDDIKFPKPIPFEDPTSFTVAATLDAAEAARFKKHGFIVKRGLIEDQATFVSVIDHIWQCVPRDLMRRDDSRSWTDAPETQWTEADSLRVGALAQNNWKMRSKDGIGTESFLINGIANHASVRQVATALMGGPPAPVRRVRGIYSVFPSKPGTENRYRPHTDYMAAHLAAMVIADDIGPGCGGFMLWPGSHLRLHPFWDTVHGGAMAAENAEPFRLAREQIIQDTTPVEFTGGRGDVIFWHPRALHSAGINQSADDDVPMVRVIVPCDFQIVGRDTFDDPDYGPGPDFQWWIDTRNYVDDVPPTAENLWEDWGL